MPAPSFFLPLNDAGSGIVNITPTIALGSATPTYTANSTRYARLSSGLFTLVSANQPRAQYSRAGIYLGYLAEGARSNALGTTTAIVRTMTDVGWIGTNITVGTATGLDGGANAAASLTATAGNATILFTTVLGAAVRTYGPWIRRTNGSGNIQVTVDGLSWTTVTVDANYPELPQSLTSASAANQIVGIRVVTNGDSVAVDFGGTLEQAAFSNPTPIPVNVSKAADLLTYVTSGNLSSTVGTCYAEFTSAAVSPAAISLISTYNGGTEGIALTVTGAGSILSLYDGTAFRSLSSAISRPIVTSLKGCSSWSGVTCSGALSGTAITGVTFDGDMGFDTVFAVGSDRVAGGAMFGAAKNIKIWPVAIPAATLKSMTT